MTHLEYFDEKMEKLKEIIARKSEERRAKDERIGDLGLNSIHFKSSRKFMKIFITYTNFSCP